VDGLRESKKSGGGGPIAGSHTAGGNRPINSGGGGNPLINTLSYFHQSEHLFTAHQSDGESHLDP